MSLLTSRIASLQVNGSQSNQMRQPRNLLPVLTMLYFFGFYFHFSHSLIFQVGCRAPIRAIKPYTMECFRWHFVEKEKCIQQQQLAAAKSEIKNHQWSCIQCKCMFLCLVCTQCMFTTFPAGRMGNRGGGWRRVYRERGGNRNALC